MMCLSPRAGVFACILAAAPGLAVDASAAASFAVSTNGLWTAAAPTNDGLTAFEMTATPGYTNGEPTTAPLTGSSAFRAGVCVEQPFNQATVDYGASDLPPGLVSSGSSITGTPTAVGAKYRLGLDPTVSNTYRLAVESLRLTGSNAVTVVKRTVTGNLSPDGMHGTLKLRAATGLTAGFTNVAGTDVTGLDAFDAAGRRAYTNIVNGSNRFFKAVIA